MKDVQAAGEAFRALQNMEIFHFFDFCESFSPSWIRVRIPNADPDPA